MVYRNSQWISTRLLAWLALTGMVSLVGCESKEEIRSYTVAKTAQSDATAATATAEIKEAPAEQSGDATDRMLVAILPVGDQAHFFKVVGPMSAMEKIESDFYEFVHKLKIVDGQPSWSTPANWKMEPGTGMRRATFRIPTDGRPLEMSVTALAWGRGQAELLDNLNRWRGQMQLPPVGAQQIQDDISEIKAGDATITVVDLSGRYAGPGMMAPFAGGRGDAGSATAPRGSAELPAGHPPIDSLVRPPSNTPATENVAAAVPKFEAPKSWRPVAAGGLRKAEFAIGSDTKSAVVTLIDFPAKAGPMIADPLSNVNRWRAEIGLGRIEEGQLEESTEAIEIDGKPAKYVRLVPDVAKPEESKNDRATLAAMVTDSDKIWFIKLLGARDTVISEEENFKEFLKSMKFSNGSGVSNGDK